MPALPEAVDLNADMGEAFGHYRLGDDEALLRIVSSANVACGFHGGDPEIMARTFALAKQNGVAVGAHPGFPDLWGFGRRVIPYSTGEIERLVAYQVGAAAGLATYAGHPITYVKPHGALGNLAESDPAVARAVTDAVRAVDVGLVCLVIAAGAQDRIARERGMRVASEIYADRAYTDEGHMVPRKQPGAVIHEPEAAAARVVKMIRAGAIETISGSLIPRVIDSVCLHSDTPEAVTIAERVRESLEEVGFKIATFT